MVGVQWLRGYFTVESDDGQPSGPIVTGQRLADGLVLGTNCGGRSIRLLFTRDKYQMDIAVDDTRLFFVQ